MASLAIDAIDSMAIAAIYDVDSRANEASGHSNWGMAIMDRWAISAVEVIRASVALETWRVSTV